MQHVPTHPHAIAAIQLASIDRAKRAEVNEILRQAQCPRSLYTLARLLRSARAADDRTTIAATA